MAKQAPRRFHFGPLERRGVLLGLRGGQLVVLVAGGALALVTLNALSSGVGVAATLLVLAAAFMAGWLPVAGRAPDEWAPVLINFLVRRVRGDHVFVSAAPLIGRTTRTEAPADTPDYLEGLDILAAPIIGGEIGIVKDARDLTYTGVLAIRGRSFSLLDAGEKERLLEQWGAILSGLNRESSAIRRVQWCERTVPDDSDVTARYFRDERRAPQASAMVQSYLQLVDDAGPATHQHEILLVLQIDARRASKSIRQAGGGDQGAATVLARELLSLSALLAGADISVEGALTPRLLARALRVAVDPAARTATAQRAVLAPEMAGVAPASAWPLRSETNWASLRTENAWHATYWVSEWPRIDVGPDWMTPLLLQARSTRTVAVIMEPISPLRAMREVERDRITDISDESVRQRAGFRTTRRKEREADNVERREDELSSGHTDYRFSAYVTVSAYSEAELDNACGEVEQFAHQSRLELRRLVGEQDIAFTFTLPLGRGLR